jgi:4-hydroxy-2-oxoheptanedioate aldolase
MQRKNRVLEKLRKGEVPIGSILLAPDPVLTEVIGYNGVDYILFDGEHGTFHPQQLEACVRACDSAGVTPMARVPVSKDTDMLAYLDTGILGVMLPHCRSAAEARAFVQACKYPPQGKRGVGTGRAQQYGTIPIPEHTKQWNEELFLVAQVEDKECVDDLDNILAVDGLDAMFVGTNDLSQSLGFQGRENSPEFRKVQAEIIKRCKRPGKYVGTGARLPYTPSESTRIIKELGCDFYSMAFVLYLNKNFGDWMKEAHALAAAR